MTIQYDIYYTFKWNLNLKQVQFKDLKESDIQNLVIVKRAAETRQYSVYKVYYSVNKVYFSLLNVFTMLIQKIFYSFNRDFH